MSRLRQPRNAPKGKNGKGTGGQFKKDTRGSDPRNIPQPNSTTSLFPEEPSYNFDELERIQTLISAVKLSGSVPDSATGTASAPVSAAPPTAEQIRQQEAAEATYLPQRVKHENLPSGPDWSGNYCLISQGYAPEDTETGRLEVRVENHTRGTVNQDAILYAYHGVTPREHREFLRNPCYYWRVNLLNNPAHAYVDEEEAMLAGVAEKCRDCGQYKNSLHHTCPAVGITSRWEGNALWVTERVNIPSVNHRSSEVSYSPSSHHVPSQESIDYIYQTFPEVKYVDAEIVDTIRSQPLGFIGGKARYFREEDGTTTIDISGVTCSCPQYRDYGTCFHMRTYQMLLHNGLHSSSHQMTPEQEKELQQWFKDFSDPAVLSRQGNWTDNRAAMEEARRFHRQDTDILYTDSPESFLADLEQERVRAETLPEDTNVISLPYRKENVLDGSFTRESGQGFGVEIEYELPLTWTQEKCEAMDIRIGQQLYEAGLTYSDRKQDYRASAKQGYIDTHVNSAGKGTWSWEHDSSVRGELVTPIMYDEPETWEKLELALSILRENGAIVGSETGSHIHVGTSSYRGSPSTYTELLRLVNQHEDAIVRLATNPKQGTHRNNGFAVPLPSVAATGYTSISEARQRQGLHGGRESLVNLGNCIGGLTDHVEFRVFDGSLDPGTIQAQILLATSIVTAAQRHVSLGGTSREKNPWGTGYLAQQAREKNGQTEALTPTETIEDSRILMSLLDTLFRKREDKALLTAVAYHTTWSEASHR